MNHCLGDGINDLEEKPNSEGYIPLSILKRKADEQNHNWNWEEFSTHLKEKYDIKDDKIKVFKL